MQNKRKAEKHHSVDELMRKTALTLVKDFQENLDEPARYHRFEAALKARNMAKIREESPAVDMNEECVAVFKADYQLQSWYKRYIGRKDLYSEEQLVKMACDAFVATQLRLASVGSSYLEENSIELVLGRAASYLASVLGRYDENYHRSLCRFGSRASVGVPAKAACEAQRWQVPISGSPEHIDWFHSEIVEQPQVMTYLERQIGTPIVTKEQLYQPISCLTMTLVPKSYKALRSIVPNTTLGSYYTKGLGDYLTERLKRAGYDVSSLQMTHKRRARQASIFNHDVTLDLSAASDSITERLIERMLPPDWLKALKLGRIAEVALPDNRVVQMETFCTMGIGFTFPLQTLVFLALLKAIESLVYAREYHGTGHDYGRITVYGDDMIFNKTMYKTVKLVFEKIGLVINIDKTFDEGPFRESCGGDFYRGVDVRPVQPKTGQPTVGATTYEAVLYKLVNGLLARWSEYEIVRTLHFLLSEINELCAIKIVPGDFPDDSGIKCTARDGDSFLHHHRVLRPKHLGNGVFRFTYLRLTPESREEVRHEPYLWAALRDRRCGDNFIVPHFDFSSPNRDISRVYALLERTTGVSTTAVPILVPKQVVTELSSPRLRFGWSCLVRRIATFLTVSHSGRYTRQSGISCFGIRSSVRAR